MRSQPSLWGGLPCAAVGEGEQGAKGRWQPRLPPRPAANLPTLSVNTPQNDEDDEDEDDEDEDDNDSEGSSSSSSSSGDSSSPDSDSN